MNFDLDLPTGILATLVALFFAWIAARMARKRDREPLGWALGGFFFPCITIPLLFIVGRAHRRDRRRG